MTKLELLKIGLFLLCNAAAFGAILLRGWWMTHRHPDWPLSRVASSSALSLLLLVAGEGAAYGVYRHVNAQRRAAMFTGGGGIKQLAPHGLGHPPQDASQTASAIPPAGTPAPVAVAPTAEASWTVGWESGLTKVFRDPKKFHGQRTATIPIALAGNEYESVQIVLFGGEAPAHITVTMGALTRTDGTSTFPADVVEIRRVGYVKTAKPDYPVSFVGEWPDPLPMAHEVDVPAHSVQPLWITIGAPDWLPAGRYAGTITLTDAEGHTKEATLQVRLWNFVLPHASHLKTAFGFYRNRLTEAYSHFVPSGVIWTGQTAELERLYMLDMLKHRLSPILDADPDREGFLPAIDYYLQIGLNAFGIGTHGGNFDNEWPTDPQEMKRVMNWYRESAKTLEEQRLLETAYVYAYDEPKPGDPRVAEVMAALHHADPRLRTLLVMHEPPDPLVDGAWLKDANILCLRISGFDPAHVEQFKRMGHEVWMYVSSPTDPYPGLVIDYPAISARILPWMSWKYGASGLLYWCVDYWKTNPWTDPAGYQAGQNGNGSLYYPSAQGPVPSIRIEALRDGMEDYEYLSLLDALIQSAEAHGGVDTAILERARNLVVVDPALVTSLRSYAQDADVLLTNRTAIAEMIEQLQALLPAERPHAIPQGGTH